LEFSALEPTAAKVPLFEKAEAARAKIAEERHAIQQRLVRPLILRGLIGMEL
jgi:hypothetical protein